MHRQATDDLKLRLNQSNATDILGELDMDIIVATAIRSPLANVKVRWSWPRARNAPPTKAAPGEEVTHRI